MGALVVSAGRPGVGSIPVNGAGTAVILILSEFRVRLGAVETLIQRVLKDSNLLFGEAGWAGVK